MIVSDFGTNDGSTVSGNAAKTQLYGYTGTISATPDFSSSSNFVKTIPSTSQVIICLSQPGGNNTQKAYLTITAQMTVENIVGGWDALC